MLIKIIKCSRNGWWYKDRIGRVYSVMDKNDGYLYVDQAMLMKEDCEILDIKEGEYVWVSHTSEDEAIQCMSKRIYTCTTSRGMHLCVHSANESSYKKGYDGYNTTAYKYIVPITHVKEMTMQDIEKLVGCKVRII